MRGKLVCRVHGGKSTGPKTPEGKARVAAAHLKHGYYTKENVERRKANAAIRRANAAIRRAYLPRRRKEKVDITVVIRDPSNADVS